MENRFREICDLCPDKACDMCPLAMTVQMEKDCTTVHTLLEQVVSDMTEINKCSITTINIVGELNARLQQHGVPSRIN